MLCGSGSDNKDEPNDKGRGVSPRNPLYQPVTPVLVPMQSGVRTVHQTVPLVVPDVEELKEQFQQQQNMLTQIKETIKENESKLSSKGKQVEAYANRLSQIRARTKNNAGKNSAIQSKTVIPSSSTPPTAGKPLTKRPSKENLRLSKENLNKECDSPEKEKTAQNKAKLSPKGKITELKKRFQENKIKFEERTGNEISKTKMIESLVENLKMQLEERDVTIQELQKIVEQPTMPNVKSDNTLRKTKNKAITSKSTQTTRQLQNDETIEVIAMQNRIYELEAKILDLEETLKEKESVIDARTQAVTLLSKDLSIKGKNTLECLEETRQEMRAMQANFVVVENQLKKELVEKDNRLTMTEDKLKKLESINFELSSMNDELKIKLDSAEKKCLDLDKKSISSIPHVETDDKLAELNNKISHLHKELDDSNKSMIKMKLDHKNKIKALNKTIEKLKETSDDKSEILRLQTMVDEFEVVREGLQNKIAELEDEKASEKKLKDTINELESQIQNQSQIIEKHLQTISNLEREKMELHQSGQDQNILIENLYAKIQNLESSCVEKDSVCRDLGLKLGALEEEYKTKLDAMKSEHKKEIEMLESCYNIKAAGGDRKEFEEYRITNELNNVQVEEQIEMLIREKQQLMEKLKSLSCTSTSTESITFETVDHSELQAQEDNSQTYQKPQESYQKTSEEQQLIITELQNAVLKEKEKTLEYREKIEKLETTLKNLEQSNTQRKPEHVEDEEPSKTQKSNIKNKIKKMQMELIESRKMIQEQNEKLTDLNTKLEEKEQLIKNYIEKIELFEKDDWGRENDWKTTVNEFEHVQELQKKCLSLENGLIELTEDCERLRKENIELVHLLSEEKVKRKKIMERLNIENYGDVTTVEFEPRHEGMEESVEILYRSVNSDCVSYWPLEDIEERVLRLIDSAEMLEERLSDLEMKRPQFSDSIQTDNFESNIRELQEKLEWSNIVLTSKETEIFRLQNLQEDSSKIIEDLQRDLKETRDVLVEKNKNHNELTNAITKKEKQIEELSMVIEELQGRLKLENEKFLSADSQLKQLMENIKQMESVIMMKESHLKEICTILSEKNLDVHNLKQSLEQTNEDLANRYKQQLESMNEFIRHKEQEYEILLSQKHELEESKRSLTAINEDICNQRVELLSKNEILEKALMEKQKTVDDLNVKLSEITKPDQTNPSEVEELKVKVKKLAANLKKKVQNEKELLQKTQDYEALLAEKENILQKLQQDFTDVNEKWITEKSEKEQFKNEFAVVLTAKTAAESENLDLKEKLKSLNTEFNNRAQKDEYKFQQMETQLQKMYETSEKMKKKQEQDQAMISKLEGELANASRMVESENQKENEELKKALDESSGKFAQSEFKYEQLKMEFSNLETELTQVKSDCVAKEAMIQTQVAVIESLENELGLAREHLKRSEESLCFAEERRSSLESKAESMLRQIEEDSKNVEIINDMSNQIQSLSESKENLRASVKSLDEKNQTLEAELKEVNAEKTRLEKELNELRQRIKIVSEDLEKLREIDFEKTTVMADESEKLKALKMDNKQKSVDIENLTKQISLLEADLQENVENSKTVERTLNFKIDELMRENAELTEKNNSLTEAKNQQQTQEEAKPKRKKSVTFKTDETDYIRDLKAQIHEYDEALNKSNEEKMQLKMELMRERLRNNVSEVVAEAEEKVESLRSTPEKVPKPAEVDERKFDAATFFGSDKAPEENFIFGQQNDGVEAANQDNSDNPSIDYDSLTWDDGWGTDGHLEEQFLSTQAVQPNQEKCERLERELKLIEDEKKKLEEELQTSQAKYAKAIKKMKEQKTACDKLQAEVNRLKSNVELSALDGAIMDELKAQIRTVEQREKELIKNLETSKAEKENLLKRINVLNAGNEKFVEMKERQDNEMERWETKNRELQMEITELRNQLLTQGVVDDKDENEIIKELNNKIKGLEWENCGLKEQLEEQQEMLELRNTAPDSGEKNEELVKKIAELNTEKEEMARKMEDEDKKSKDVIEELQQQVTALATENETLQQILGEIKAENDKMKMPRPVSPAPTEIPFVAPESSPPPQQSIAAASPPKETKIFDYFKSAPVNDIFSSVFVPPVCAEPVVEPVIERKAVTEVQGSNTHSEQELDQLRLERDLLQQQLDEAQSTITAIKNEHHEMTEKYRAEYEDVLSFHIEEKNNALHKMHDLEQGLAIKIEELNNMSMRMKDLEQAVLLKTEELNELNRGRQELEQAFGMKAEESSGMWMKINSLEEFLAVKTEELNNANARLRDLECAVGVKGDELNKAMIAVADAQEKLRLKEAESNDLSRILAEKTEELNRCMMRLQQLEGEFQMKSASLDNAMKMNEDLVKNMEHNIPEIESLNRSLNAEKSAAEDLHRSITEKEQLLARTNEEMNSVKASLTEAEDRMREAVRNYENQLALAEEYCEAKEKLEDLVSNLQTELQTANMELELSRNELEMLRKSKEEIIAGLENRIEELTGAESRDLKALREELQRRIEDGEKQLERESIQNEEIAKLQNASKHMEDHIEALKSELKVKENDIFELSQTLDEEQKQLGEMRALLEVKDAEIMDLRQALSGFQEEISSFRNFEKQVKELRLAQIKQTGSNVAITAEGDPDFTNWTEHELVELNSRLQSDLDTALYMLHQRDIRCDELTFELMQLLEERDTLQLRLSTAIRINEELRSLTSNAAASHLHDTRQDNKDVVDQSNDRQAKMAKLPEEDFQQLAQKISELHSVGYMKDKTIQDESLQRHRDQMTLLGRTSESDLGRDGQPSPMTNWIRTGKPAPKIMHI